MKNKKEIKKIAYFANCRKDRADEIKKAYDSHIRGIFPKFPKFKTNSD